jgi:hypothetical protein
MERGKVKREIRMRRPVTHRYFHDDPDPPPFIKALAEVRHLATREGWCYPHVQAIIVAIDQYAEKATGNRDFFLNKPYGAGASRRNENIP